MTEYGFKSNFLQDANNSSQPSAQAGLNNNNTFSESLTNDRRIYKPPPYPSLPPECSPCSNKTNFRPIHPLNDFNKAYFWVDTHAFGGIPSTALHGGVDIDGSQIYVGRAYHLGDWIPAKVIPQKNVAYICYDGEEHAKETFQILCEQRFDWIHHSGGNIPPNAVEGGRTCDGETLYIGRVHHEGSQTVGKVHPSHGSCYIPFDGKELAFQEYELLVIRS